MNAIALPPSQLSHELRTETSPDLSRRRWAIGLSFAGVLIGKIVGAYQAGLIKRLPDILPGKIFDAEKVDASDYAYKRLQMPDAMQMIATYGITASLASAGGKERARQNPALPIATAGKRRSTSPPASSWRARSGARTGRYAAGAKWRR